MNKAITDGIDFMPPEFSEGLDVWSSGDGTPGSDTYDGSANAAYVASDQDFGGCLEILKTDATQKLRYMGETPMLPGCYLQITARVKAVSGNLPNVQIAAWAGASGGSNVSGVTQTGPSTALTSYGDIVEVTAIVGSGERTGVDMVWGTTPVYGHFGLNLTGSTGGVVRIDDIEIEDVTDYFHRNMMNMVDVVDYGAIGDGSTDDAAAFEAADAAAAGRKVLVSAGTYYLGSSVNFANPVEFEGTVTMPDAAILSLTKNFDLPNYIAAFGDEELALRKAIQSLFNDSDHESLDLGGRRININEPIDVAYFSNRTSYSTRRHIRNGQLEVKGDTAWDPDVVTSQATYDPGNSRTLSNVVNVANVQVGSLVTGNGVGREIYVREVNVGAGTITLSNPLYDANTTQTYTFTRYKYVLDFSGFDKLSRFSLSDLDILCDGKASGILMARSGTIFHVKDTFFTRPAHRGISSPGEGCQGMLVDRCQFLTNEASVESQNRVSICINTNANDVKIRNNRASNFRNFLVLGGSNAIVMGNHFFQGDNVTDGVRTPGIIIAIGHCSTTISGNYVDNCSIQWTNEYDSTPDFTGGFSFSALSITDNVFLSGDVASWFTYLVVRPHGSDQFLNGLTVTGNKFRSINGTIDRIESIDTSYADLEMWKAKDVIFYGNTFHNISKQVENPLRIDHDQNTNSTTWVVDTDDRLPFGGEARFVDSIVPTGAIRNSSNVIQSVLPYMTTSQGSNNDQVHINWPTAVHGDARVVIRMDS